VKALVWEMTASREIERLSDRELERLIVACERAITSNRADLQEYELYVVMQHERQRRVAAA
jgi:hypothetical protein